MFKSEAERQAAFAHMGPRTAQAVHTAHQRFRLAHPPTRAVSVSPTGVAASPVDHQRLSVIRSQVEGRSRLGHFFARHPGVKRSLVRSAYVAGAAGALLGGAAIAGRRAKAIEGALRETRHFYYQSASATPGLTASKGLRAFRTDLERKISRLGKARGRAGTWARRLKHASFGTAGVGAGWVAFPSVEGHATRIQAHRAKAENPHVPVYRRRRGRLERIR